VVLATVSTSGRSEESSSAATAEELQAPVEQHHQEIVVIAPALFPDIQPERTLDQTAIESYGVGTVDELLAEIQAELGDDEIPLLLVNGERINDLDEIGAFPIEILRKLQVLPRGSAVKAGGTSSQRVVSLTLHRQSRSATISAAPKFATEGGWHSIRGEGILTHVRGSTRANIALRVRDDSPLLESERGIIQPNPRYPFAARGNVIAYPDLSGEIDPLLSIAAGEVVTVVPVPAGANPTLVDFAAKANYPAVTGVGPFRSLRPEARNYDLNGTFSTRLAPWLTSTATLRFNESSSRYLRGLPSAIFVVSADNPESPFSRDVALAVYGIDPLRYRSRHRSGEANFTLNANFGKWTGNFHARHVRSKDESRSDRESTFAPILLGNEVDPFTDDLSEFIKLAHERTSARSTSTIAELSLTGPVLVLPPGPVLATVEGRLAWNDLHSRSTFAAFADGDFRRNERSFRGTLEIPLTSRANDFGAGVGDLRGSAEYSRTRFSDFGALEHHALGLTWEPIPALRLRALIEATDEPPLFLLLGYPVTVTTDARIFDPLTGQTVDVTQISGGNSELEPQRTKVTRLTALARLVPRLNLNLDAEYTNMDVRDLASSLPITSAPIMLAFPERFIRDSSGVLTTVDLRPVNFTLHNEERLRWGLSMNAKLGGGRLPGAVVQDGQSGTESPNTYLQLAANHTVVFSDKIIIRPGLEPVDLLGGGAIGIGGGRVRHQVEGTAALTSGGLGARAGLAWRGRSTLDTKIGGVSDTLHFSPIFLVNLRLFADARRFLPDSNWAKGLRFSLDVINLTNDRQRVRDSLGNTPLQYQPAYRDPIGRTIEFEIRKVF
jgi:hypothetical protein